MFGILKSHPYIGFIAAIGGSALLDVEIWLRVVGFVVGISVGVLTVILKIRELRRSK